MQNKSNITLNRPSFQETLKSEISSKKIIAEEEDHYDDDEKLIVNKGAILPFNELPNTIYYEGRGSETRLSEGRLGIWRKKEGGSNLSSNNPSPSHVQNVTNIINYNINHNVIINNNIFIAPSGGQRSNNNSQFEKENSQVINNNE